MYGVTGNVEQLRLGFVRRQVRTRLEQANAVYSRIGRRTPGSRSFWRDAKKLELSIVLSGEGYTKAYHNNSQRSRLFRLGVAITFQALIRLIRLLIGIY